METSHINKAPFLLRNIVTSLFIYADGSLLNLSEKYRLLELLRALLLSSFLFFLRLLPYSLSLHKSFVHEINAHYPSKKEPPYVPSSGLARALSQLLSLVNDIPASSRKYEVVRSLAETVIDENNRENVEALREVNRSALAAAFERTLRQLEAAVKEQGHEPVARIGEGLSGSVEGGGSVHQFRLRWVLKAVGAKFGIGKEIGKRCAEKLAAELLWLAEKLVGSGFEEEAVSRWAWCSNLAWLSLSADPRLQSTLVKVSAFLFKKAKDLGAEEMNEAKKQQHRQIKKKMLISWLPLLCRASIGTDAPVLSRSERAEMEMVLAELIEMVGEEEEQEQVLSLWLHHFTHCPASDWPNLHACYARWCSASRSNVYYKGRFWQLVIEADSNTVVEAVLQGDENRSAFGTLIEVQRRIYEKNGQSSSSCIS